MKKYLQSGFLVGSFSYLLVVLISLVRGQPLKFILYKGLITFMLLFLAGTCLKLVLEVVRQSKDQKEQEEMAQLMAEENEEKELRQKEFSPLEPPVLEIDDES